MWLLVDDIDLKTSSRTLEKFIILNNLELNYTFIVWMFWRYTPKENNLKTYTSSRTLEKFIILNNIELNYMFIAWMFRRYTPKENNLSQKHRMNAIFLSF